MKNVLLLATLNEKQTALLTSLLAELGKTPSLREVDTTSQPATPQVTDNQASLTLEEVRSRLAAVRNRNPEFDLIALFKRFSASKLSEIDPKHYPEVLFIAEGRR